MTSAKPNPRLDQLRVFVREQGGNWTTRRAIEALGAALDFWPTPERARLYLNRLTDEGLLIKHGPRGYLWTQPEPTTLTTLTEAIAQQVRAIPGVVSARVGEDAGLIGVKRVDGAFFFVEVRPGRTAPVLTDAEEREFRDSQADYDSHLHDTDDEPEEDL